MRRTSPSTWSRPARCTATASTSSTSASAKILRFGRSRSTFALDLYNALNSSAVLTYNTAFVPGGTWLQPLTILTPRFVRITGEIDF